MTTTVNHQNEIQEAPTILSQILDDEKKIGPEKRSDNRELLFVPVQIHQDQLDFTLGGFTRDISSRGVCLIMPQLFRAGTKATIKLAGKRSNETSSAKCCWSGKFGSAYWISGWSLSSEWPIGRLLKDDRLVELNQRDSDRVKAALPVNIYIPGHTFHIPGFTRNLSRDGICLMSKAETLIGQVANLDIIRLNGETSRVESHCLWAEQYDDENWVSGWKFND